MKVYVNDRNEIKDVGSTKDTSLIELVIDDVDNPFANWSIARICCYRVDVRNGHVCMFTPYVSTHILEHLDKLGKVDERMASEMLDMVEFQADTLYELSLLEIEVM